ncbi:MAG: hypothetical protein OXH57_06250 [Ekhidna sp.]|nr:hypothetical protein [Ekhidna sp.]
MQYRSLKVIGITAACLGLSVSCQTEDLNDLNKDQPSRQIDVDSIYSVIDTDFKSLVKKMNDEDLTFNDATEISLLTKETFQLDELGAAEPFFYPEYSARSDGENIEISEGVQAFIEEYSKAMEGKDFGEAMNIINTRLSEMEFSEPNDDNVVITLALIASKVVLETYQEHPELFLSGSENARNDVACAKDVAIGAIAGAAIGALIGGTIGTFIVPGAGTVAGALNGARWGGMIGAAFGGFAGGFMGGVLGGDCV